MEPRDTEIEPTDGGVELTTRCLAPVAANMAPNGENDGADSDDGSSSASWVILDEDVPDDHGVVSMLTESSHSDPPSVDSANFATLHSSGSSTVEDCRFTDVADDTTPIEPVREAESTLRRRRVPVDGVMDNDNDSDNDQLCAADENGDSVATEECQQSGPEDQADRALSSVGRGSSGNDKDRWDDTDLSTLPDQTLPDAWSAADNRLRHYVHQRNTALNHLLTVVMVLCLTCALGLGAGHFLGWLHHTELTEEIVQNLDEKLVHLRDDLMTCMTTEEDQDLDNKWIKELLHENEALMHQLQGDDPTLGADSGVGCSESVAELRSQLNQLRVENERLRATVAALHAAPAGPVTAQNDDELMIEQRNQINELRTENSELARELRRHRYLSPTAPLVPRQVEVDSAAAPSSQSTAPEATHTPTHSSVLSTPSDHHLANNGSEEASLAEFYARRSSERQRTRLTAVPPVPINWMLKRAELRALRRGSPEHVSWLLQRQRARQLLRLRRAEQAEVHADDQRWRRERVASETGLPRGEGAEWNRERGDSTSRSQKRASQRKGEEWTDFSEDHSSAKHSHDSTRKRTYEYRNKHRRGDDHYDDRDDDDDDDADDSYVKKVTRYIRKVAKYQRKMWRAANRKAEKMYKKINENYWKHFGDKKGYYQHQHAYQF